MAEIVDQHGQPITREVASIRLDPHRTFYGTRLTNEDDTLKTRGGAKGLKIYDELKRDAHAGAVLFKRKLAVTSRPWRVEPASKAAKDVEAAGLVQRAFEHLRFNATCKRLLDATLKGYAVAEVMWEVRDGQWLPKCVLARDQRRFVFTVDGELRMITRSNTLDGEALPDHKFIIHRHGGDDDTPYGLGLGNMLFWPVFFKRQGITFWLSFADKFGSPTPLGKYPSGAQPSEQKKLLAALAAIAQDTGVIIPEGMVIEFLEATRSGSVDTYEKLVRYMDEQISKAVLGETMSTTAASAGMGSNQASVHNDVRLELAQDDADDLAETINDTLVRWIVEFNFGEGVGLPKLVRDFQEPEDLTARATRDKTITEMGWEPTEQYMLETYGPGWVKKAPDPNPFAGLAAIEQPAPAAPGAAGTASTDGNVSGDAATDDTGDANAFAEDGRALQAVGPQRAFNLARQEAISSAAEQLAAGWNQLMGKRVQAITAQLENSGDLVQFRESLDALMNTKPDANTVDAIARATFAAHIIGRGPAKAQPKGWFEKLKALVAGKKDA
jgi:phage gp29-like protein